MRARRGLSLALAAALVAAPLLTTGCASSRRAMSWLGLGTRYASGVSEEDLRDAIALYAQSFVTSVTAAADRIVAEDTPRELNRRAVLWKVRIVPLALRAAGAPEAQQSYAALLTLAIGQEQYLTEGEGADLFGDRQAIAVETAGRLEREALALGASFLSPKDLEAIRWQVEGLAWKYPMRGVFLSGLTTGGFAEADLLGAFNWVLAIPLSPFRALEGVDSGAQAIHEFNATARQFSGIVASLPELVRWQSELLLYDVEDRESTSSLLGSFQTLAESSARLTDTAQNLPAELRVQTDALLTEIDARQGGLQKTLADARGGLADLDTSLAKATTLAASMQTLADQVERIGVTWQGVATTLRGPDDRAETDARPFDITEYERTAARVESASNAARELALELRASGDALRGALDAALVRAILLIAAYFGLRLLFRTIEGAVTRRRGP